MIRMMMRVGENEDGEEADGDVALEMDVLT